jgi:hypothetical protein
MLKNFMHRCRKKMRKTIAQDAAAFDKTPEQFKDFSFCGQRT